MSWTESNSAEFIEHGLDFGPDRETQMETLCGVIAPPTGGHVVELCCGEGLLSTRLLNRFPVITVHGYDGSPLMIQRAQSRNPKRFEAVLFDLAETDWRTFDFPVYAIVSSLAIHHFDGEQKRVLFRDMARCLTPGGVIAIADIVQPATARATEIAAQQWDASVTNRDAFEEARWNLFRYPDPETDKPSTLFDQLQWLHEAGLRNIDVHYMRAGHAIFSAENPSWPMRPANCS